MAMATNTFVAVSADLVVWAVAAVGSAVLEVFIRETLVVGVATDVANG